MSFFKKGLTSLTDGLGLTDSGASNRALAAQAGAMAEANRIQEQMYTEGKERLQPWLNAGTDGFNSLVDLTNNYQDFNQADGHFKGHSGVFSMDDFQEDPGYQFRMDEGMKGINRSAAARGGRNGGATLKALAKYGQNIASDEYGKAYNRFNQDYGNAYNRYNADQGNRFSRFGNLANYGMSANNSLNSMGSNFANNMANQAMTHGNSIASAEMNRGNQMKDLWKMGAQGAGMMAGACWVARAIFGEDNPKWLDARFYVLNIAPNWFRDLYLEKGEEFSHKVKKSKLLKLFLRPVFEYFALVGNLRKERGIYVR